METKQYVVLETTKNDLTFKFMMPVGGTFGQAIDAAYEFLNEAHKMASKSIEATKPQEEK